MYRGERAACLSSRRRYSTVSGPAAGRRVAGVGGVTHTLFPMQGGAQVFEAAGGWRGAGAPGAALQDRCNTWRPLEWLFPRMEPSSARLVFIRDYHMASVYMTLASCVF